MFIYYEKFNKGVYEARKWDATDGLCRDVLTREVYKIAEKSSSLPWAIIRAEMIAFVLDNARVDVDPYDPFPCNIDCGNVINDVRMKAVEQAERNEILDSHVLSSSRSLAGLYNGWFDFSHLIPDWERIFSLGVTGIANELTSERKKKEADGTLTSSQKDYYDAGLCVYAAISRYFQRRSRILSKIGTNMAQAASASFSTLAKGTPRSLYDVMLACFSFYSILTFVEGSFVRSLGALDKLFYPYYQKEISRGEEGKRFVETLIDCFFVKWNSMNVCANIPFTVGGPINNENDGGINGLSRLLVDRYLSLDIISPKIQLRCNPDTPQDFIKKILSGIRKGNSSFVFCNDEIIIPALENTGISHKDACGYVPVGCYEPLSPGKEIACSCNGLINLAKVVEITINGGRDYFTGEKLIDGIPDNFESYDELEKNVIETALVCARQTADIIADDDRHYYRVSSSPVLSGTFSDSVKKGIDVYYGGAKYNNSSINIIGLASCIDTLEVIRNFVFDRKIVTLSEFNAILKSDWTDSEDLRLKAISFTERYGNNLPHPDALAKKIIDALSGFINGRPNGRGGVFRTGLFSVDNYLTYGNRTGASADGRKAGEPISKNLSPSAGKDYKGVTAMINSVCKLDMKNAPNGAVTDIILHPSAVSGDDGLDAWYGLVKCFFAKGGQCIHFNVFSADTLKAAQRNPDKYRNLQVRVCGWNAYFTSLCETEQNQFIINAESSEKAR